ncbi:uncharacterized calcium-binding protein At1g02270 isoform X1 [Raphanus sativus]|uniref:Uncharacterized calcium-binding protein At1g02270 isoform X1 n=1 Tax=Raphanus sativus TaxID=3726 RepID=A0A9W3DH38_RAPSA|nr:uncharacterized calcium-binding protein At1g02270 isoform X1 [Raphanus sativus]XP_056862741.1 uncharacterized calcium-binding protein At1g02270 isoform X1 [Raphanus sativus]XP_056862742.1 uncharacterized calcium-binding protein At1g02270 isoform X1 [Raphanus sativus]XP_056862743.1 uncharacterized calcium-binding protein At1g02270 isoform X1 [Raphanus sativus]
MSTSFSNHKALCCPYDTAHRYRDSKAYKWVCHSNHLGSICAVDSIWLLNPNRYRNFLQTSWSKYLLRRASLNAKDAFAFLKTTMMVTNFMELLIHLRVFIGLMTKDTNDLWIQADFDGNSLKQFQHKVGNHTLSEQRNAEDGEANGNQEQMFGFSVKNTALFPFEVEK